MLSVFFMCVSSASGDHIVDTYGSMALVMGVYVASFVCDHMYGSSVFSSVLLSVEKVRWVYMMCMCSCICCVLVLV